MIKISTSEYINLLTDSLYGDALDAGGVDSWIGRDYSIDQYIKWYQKNHSDFHGNTLNDIARYETKIRFGDEDK